MNLTKNEHGYYEVRVKGPDGKYHTKTTKQKCRTRAMEALKESKIAEIEMAAEMGILSQDVITALTAGRKVTVEGALAAWGEFMRGQHLSPRSVENGLSGVKAWAEWSFSTKKAVSALRRDSFDAWINGKGPQKYGTRMVMLSALRSFCRFCANSGWILGNPANLVSVDMSTLSHQQKETMKRPCFTEEEIAALHAITAPGQKKENSFWHAAVIIARYTGMRLGDICRMEWDSLDLNSGYLTVWTQKRDKRVCLPLEPAILRETMAGLEHEDERYIFPRERMTADDTVHRSWLSVQFGRLCNACGIYGKTFHCLRATYCTDCDSKGVPIEHISSRVGHANTETTMGYIRS